jgi:hypothetical protein
MECKMRIKEKMLPTVAILCLTVLSTVGCQGSQLGSKRWSGGVFGQGTEERQKYRAASFDPYPLNEIPKPAPRSQPQPNRIQSRHEAPLHGQRLVVGTFQVP